MFIWQTPAEWLMPSAQHERITAMSSTHVAMCGSQSLTQVPLWPCCFHWRLLARIGESNSPIAVMTRAEARRDRLAREFVEQRLRIEGIDVPRPAFHEQEDHALGFRGEMRLARQQRLRDGASLLLHRRAERRAAQQIRQRERAEARAGAGEEIATGGGELEVTRGPCQST